MAGRWAVNSAFMASMSMRRDIDVMKLNDLLYFVRAVDHGGFAAAARALGIPRSTVSKRVAELERDLSAVLIERSSRHFSPTNLGAAFYRHAAASLLEAEAARDVILRNLEEPRGTVRVTAALPRAQLLAPYLPLLAASYPRIQLLLNATDAVIDLSHLSDLSCSDLIQRRLETQPVVLVASPSYLLAHGTPTTPAEVAGHAGLVADVVNPASGWLLERGPACERVFPNARLVANESSVLLAGAVSGLGLTCLPLRLCERALKLGELVRVLPGYRAGQLTTSLLMPPRRADIPAVRKVADFLVEHMARRADG